MVVSHIVFSRCRGVSFYVSGASVPGEGELKCIDWVKHMCSSGTEESTVIIGGDADLILQGLALGQVCSFCFSHYISQYLHRLAFRELYRIIKLGIGDAFHLLAPSPFEFFYIALLLLCVLHRSRICLYFPRRTKARGAYRRCGK